MENQAVLERLRELVAPVAKTLGLEIWGIEIAGGAGRPLVRVFLDSAPGADGQQSAGADESQRAGVDVEQCARVSRQLGLALDVEDIIHGAYQLEVSSPGLERRFFAFSQLAPYVGRTVDVTLAAPRQDRKRFRGVLAELGEDDFRLDYEGLSDRFAWSEVTRAKLVYEFETPTPPRGRAKE